MDFNGFDFENFGCPLFDDGDAELDAVDGSPKTFATLTNELLYQPVQPTHGEVPQRQESENPLAVPNVPIEQEEEIFVEPPLVQNDEAEMEEATVPQPRVPTTSGSLAMPDEVIPREFYHKNKWALRKDLTYPEWKVLTPKQRNTKRRIMKENELTEEKTLKMKMVRDMRRMLALAEAKVAELRLQAPMMP